VTDNFRVSNSALAAWCSFDWANSAFPTVITTFVFAAYFTEGVSTDKAAGTAAWGYAISASAILIAVLSPILGAIADNGGRRKPWLLVLTMTCVAASAGLWWVEPDASFAFMALVLVVVANTSFEIGMVFYNAMLADLAPPDKLGRLSGWAWGLGYFGGLACLAVMLVGFIQTDTPWLGLSKDMAEHVRISGPVVAVWFALFSLPMFLWAPDKPKSTIPAAQAIKEGMQALAATIQRIREFRNISRFLIARMFFIDGLNTLFAFGGIYAVGTFGFSFEDLILFGIGMNVTGGLGAAGFAWADDRFGARVVIMVAVSGLFVLSAVVLVVESKALFWAFGLPLGLFVGPAQAASRSMMARMAPVNMRTKMFGLFALSGKATAFMGPALLGWVTVTTGSQRWGMATILAFFVAGLWLMRGVREA
jgi:UMF1 family MFS transporter